MESLTQKNVEATASLKLGKGNLSFGALLGGEVFFNTGAEGFRQLDWTFYACPTTSVGTGVATRQPRLQLSVHKAQQPEFYPVSADKSGSSRVEQRGTAEIAKFVFRA